MHVTGFQFFFLSKKYNNRVKPKGIRLGKTPSNIAWISIGASPLGITY